MNVTSKMIVCAEAVAKEAVGRLMDAIPTNERTDAMGLLLSTVTSSCFISQVLAKEVGVTPSDWQEHFLSVTATALMQFNYDTLHHLSKEHIAVATIQAGLRFTEYLDDAIAKMLNGAPDVPVSTKQ